MHFSNKPVFNLDCEGLSANYDSFVALEVERLKLSGNTIAVVGHNGAGKSTFLKAILGLVKVSGKFSTSITINGEQSPLKPNKGMAFCPENGAIFADVTVEDYVKFWCRIKCSSVNYYKKEGSKYIDSFELSPLFRKLGRELSKGQRRRVQTAIGFLTSPKAFIFDEPFCGLDIKRTFELQEILKSESTRTAIVLASHRMEVVERLADYVVVLKDGKVSAAGSREQVTNELCGDGVLISNVKNPEELTSCILDHLSCTLITQNGDNIRILGKGITPDILRTQLAAYEIKDYSIKESQPGLVDALQFHFKVNKSVS